MVNKFIIVFLCSFLLASPNSYAEETKSSAVNVENACISAIRLNQLLFGTNAERLSIKFTANNLIIWLYKIKNRPVSPPNTVASNPIPPNATQKLLKRVNTYIINNQDYSTGDSFLLEQLRDPLQKFLRYCS